MTTLLHIPDLDQFDQSESLEITWSVVSATSASVRHGNLTSFAAEIGSAPVVALLPAARVTFISTVLPPVSRQRRDALLRFAIEDKLTIDPATVHAIVIEQNSASTSREHVVAAVDRAWFQRVLSWLASAQVGVAIVAPVSAATLAVDGEWELSLGSPGGDFAVRPDGFAISLDDAQSAVAGAASAPPFALTVALREAKNADHAPTRLNVAFPALATTVASDLASAWANALGVPVRISTLAAGSQAGSGNPGSNVVALEKSLRNANLLTDEFARLGSGAEARARWKSALRPALLLSCGLIAVYLTGLFVDTWQLNGERRRIDGEMRKLFLSTFPNATAIVDAPLQMSRNLATMQRERGVANALNDPLRKLLSQLTSTLRAGGVENVPSAVAYADGRLTLTFRTASPAAAATLQARISAVVMASTLNAPSVAFEQSDVRITCRTGAERTK